MDRKIEKKKWTKTRFLYVASASILGVIVILGFSVLNKKVYKVDASKISVKEVSYGDFQEMILIDGDVEPIDLVLVNTLEGGTVEEIFTEDGIEVKSGTPLMRLSNPGVTLSYMNQETAIVEQINNLRNLKLSLEKDQRTLAESLIDIQNQLTKEERAFKVDSALFAQNVIAKNDYQDRKQNYAYLKTKRDFIKDNVNKSAKDNQTQISQIDASIALMQRNLNMIHTNIEKMLVKAPVTGMLSSFDPVVGETYSANQTVAKIDVKSGFKIIGAVDEFYLTSVKPGQPAEFYFNGDIIKLQVKKVLPEVINRRFEIELEFVDEVPNQITIGQSIQVRLELSQAQKALMIPRGNYFQTSGGQFVYVLDGKGAAHKRMIKLGSQNPSYYQVLDGLTEGEKFISSGYDQFKNYETLKIND